MRQSAEHECGIPEQRLFGSNKRYLALSYAKYLSALAMCSGERKLEGRVSLDECAELAARVSAGA